LLFLTIILKKSLRQRPQTILIAGMAAADIMYGLGTFSLGLYRFLVMLYGVDNDPTTPWSCVISPPNMIQYIGLQLSVIMNTVVSIDRFIAVAYPIRYRLLTASDMKKTLGLVGILGVILLLHLLGSAYFFPQPMEITKICSAAAFSVNFSLFMYTSVSVVGCSSVFIYVGVFFAYRKATRKPTQVSMQSNEQHLMERRLTVTLGIISLSTLFLFTVPYSILAVTHWMNVPTPQSFLLIDLSRISAFINVVIYVQRQKEIRQGMWNLIRCKTVQVHNINVGSTRY
jgi:hypothetical protein